MTRTLLTRTLLTRTLLTALAITLLLPATAAADPIHWDTPIQWTPWAEALGKAQAENKPVCLVVYADWCPKCRKIAPLFKDPKLLEQAGRSVMVLQNHDEKPEWLDQRFGEFGNYVPRIFFLDKQGKVDTTITSGHPRFPYFYRPNAEGLAQLVAAMNTAASKVGGPAQAAPPRAAAPAMQAAGAPQAAAPKKVAVAPAQQSGGGMGQDLPVILALMIGAIAAVWFVSRGSGSQAASGPAAPPSEGGDDAADDEPAA